MHAVGLPVSSGNIIISHMGETYSLLLDTDTFDRAGEDGDIPIIPLCGGDEFVGEVLEGSWRKNWTANISTFCATIDSGILRLTGVAGVAGVYGYGWINGHHPIPLMSEMEITIAMESPIDDTGAVANRDIQYEFYLGKDKLESNPNSQPDLFLIQYDIDESGLLLALATKIATAWTVLFTGSTYDDATGRATGNLEATIWRLVFNGKPGTAGATLSVYLKQSDTLANAETATENELTTSPYDVSDWLFNIGYPAYLIGTQNTTYFGATFDSANRATSGYIRVTYPPQFGINYNYTEADYGEGDVELWDGDPALAASQRVYDEDHEFTYKPYLQNGLIRIQVDEGVSEGVKLFWWNGATYTQAWNVLRYRLMIDLEFCRFPYLSKIVSISPEKTVLDFRYQNSASEDNDFFADVRLTIKRGLYYIELDLQDVFPVQDVQVHWFPSIGSRRFSTTGDVNAHGLNDSDVAETATNITMTDNFGVGFDDTGNAVLMFGFSNKKPTEGTAAIRALSDGMYWVNYDPTDISGLKTWFGAVPFSLVANLFEEAEDATLGGGAGTVTDAAASPLLGANNAVQLNAAGENVYWDFTAGTNLPAGRYLAVVRAREVDDEDMEVSVINDPLGVPSYRNEENAVVTFALGATFAYYGVFFDITDADVAGTDTMLILVEKADADADEIRIDYFLIIPIGNGEDWPQDLSHSALRGVTPHRRLCER